MGARPGTTDQQRLTMRLVPSGRAAGRQAGAVQAVRGGRPGEPAPAGEDQEPGAYLHRRPSPRCHDGRCALSGGVMTARGDDDTVCGFAAGHPRPQGGGGGPGTGPGRGTVDGGIARSTKKQSPAAGGAGGGARGNGGDQRPRARLTTIRNGGRAAEIYYLLLNREANGSNCSGNAACFCRLTLVGADRVDALEKLRLEKSSSGSSSLGELICRSDTGGVCADGVHIRNGSNVALLGVPGGQDAIRTKCGKVQQAHPHLLSVP